MPSCNTYHLTWVSYRGHGLSLHGCSSKAQPLLLTFDEGYLLTAALPDLQCGMAFLGPPAPLPKGVREILAQSETHVKNNMESQL